MKDPVLAPGATSRSECRTYGSERGLIRVKECSVFSVQVAGLPLAAGEYCPSEGDPPLFGAKFAYNIRRLFEQF